MLQLQNDTIIIDPDLFVYEQFRRIWERDKTEDKHEAYAYLALIFHFHNPKSSYYIGYPESVRREEIMKRIFPENMKDAKLYDDKDLIQAMDLYKEFLQLSTFRGVLDIGKQALYDIAQSLKSSKTKTGTKLNDMGKLTKAMEEINKAQEMVDKDELNSRVKGQHAIRDRER